MASETKTQDPRPKTQSRGFTLIELLIVIGIMLILVTLAATTMRPDVEGRRIRESARSVNVYLATARNRAMETGRPAGVIFRRLGGAAAAMDLDQCEVPPSFCGDSETAVAAVQVYQPNHDYIYATLYQDFSGTIYELPGGIVRPGDLIQFNLQGPLYRILGDTAVAPGAPVNTLDGDGYVVTTAGQPRIYVTASNITQNLLVPWTDSTPSAPLPYRIFRAPMKGAAQPLELPAGAVVDFTASGENDFSTSNPRYQFSLGNSDVAILFSPTGGVDRVYVGNIMFTPTNPIYLLVGKREKLLNGYSPGNTNPDTMTNYQDQNNLWVVINPQTGLIYTEPLGDCSGAADEQAAVRAARGLAAEAKGMGGR